LRPSENSRDPSSIYSVIEYGTATVAATAQRASSLIKVLVTGNLRNGFVLAIHILLPQWGLDGDKLKVLIRFHPVDQGNLKGRNKEQKMRRIINKWKRVGRHGDVWDARV
jgi:hypothetical protein